jgi:hypothetical protein
MMATTHRRVWLLVLVGYLTLWSPHLAELYRAQGRYTAAATLHQRALTIQARAQAIRARYAQQNSSP